MYAKTTLTAVLALLASTAFAGDEAKMGAETALPEFTTLDANSDGSVSKDEAQSSAALVDKWDTLDADQNGSLSSAEYSSAGVDSGIESESDTEEESDY